MSSELWYDSDEDVLGIEFDGERIYRKSEVAPNVIVDLPATGEIIGIEILKATHSFKRDIPTVISKAKKRN